MHNRRRLQIKHPNIDVKTVDTVFNHNFLTKKGTPKTHLIPKNNQKP